MQLSVGPYIVNNSPGISSAIFNLLLFYYYFLIFTKIFLHDCFAVFTFHIFLVFIVWYAEYGMLFIT